MSIRARRVCLSLLSVAGTVRIISALLLLTVSVDVGGVRIMRDSSVFTDLLLLWICVERPLECLEAEREWRLERLEQPVWLYSYLLFL